MTTTGASFRWQHPPRRWVVVLFLAPGAVFGALASFSASPGHYIGIAALIGALMVAFKSPGKYWGVLLHMFVWGFLLSRITAAAAFELWQPLWGGTLVATIIVGGALAVRIAAPWGAERHARLGVREWEWVYTGPEFASNHRLFRRGLGIWFSVLVLLLAGSALLLVPKPSWYDYLLHGFFLFVVIPLVRLHPSAYPLMLIAIGLMLLAPVSIVVPDALSYPVLPLGLVFQLMLVPLAFYWADGVRPNLIYRHRFERLVPQNEEP